VAEVDAGDVEQDVERPWRATMEVVVRSTAAASVTSQSS